MTTQYLLQLVISGLVIGSIYAAVALGFTIIYKATRVVNFAQGEFLMVGAYVCYAFLVQMHVPFWAALLLTILFALAMAVILERLVLRPMIGEPIISIIMVTIGLSLVMRSLVTAIWGNDILVYEPKLFPQETVSIGGIPVSQEFIWCFVLSMVLLAVFSVFFKFSKAGVAMRATAFNQQTAQSMGISVKSIFALSWIISAIVSGIGPGMVKAFCGWKQREIDGRTHQLDIAKIFVRRRAGQEVCRIAVGRAPERGPVRRDRAVC